MRCKWKITAAAMTLAVLISLAGAARAEDEPKLSASASVTYAERYIWRGLPINEEAVLQPGVEVSSSGVTLGAWANLDLTDWGKDRGYGDESGKATEIDYYASVEKAIGPVTLSGGFINYTFPHVTPNATTEIFGGIGFNVPLSPILTAYVDENAMEGANYNSLDVSHSFGPWGGDDIKVGIDLAGRLGYANGNYFKLYHGLDRTPYWYDWSATVALPVSLPAGFTLTPAYQYTSLMENDVRELVDDNDLDPEAGIFTINLSWSN